MKSCIHFCSCFALSILYAWVESIRIQKQWKIEFRQKFIESSRDLRSSSVSVEEELFSSDIDENAMIKDKIEHLHLHPMPVKFGS